MRFRQRIAWLVTVLFLAATCALVYYIFEINEHFNRFAIDHIQKYHIEPGADHSHGFWHHIVDVPAVVLLIIFLMAYLQIFFMILACTKPEPRHSFAYVWPCFLYNKCRMFVSNCSSHIHGSQKSEIYKNGSVTIDSL